MQSVGSSATGEDVEEEEEDAARIAASGTTTTTSWRTTTLSWQDPHHRHHMTLHFRPIISDVPTLSTTMISAAVDSNGNGTGNGAGDDGNGRMSISTFTVSQPSTMSGWIGIGSSGTSGTSRTPSDETELIWQHMLGGHGDVFDPYGDPQNQIVPSWMHYEGDEFDDEEDEDEDDEDYAAMLRAADRPRQARLDEAQIDAMLEVVDPSALRTLADDELCPICLCCLNRRDSSDVVERIRRCSHAFCGSCLRRGLARSTVCPVCKTDLCTRPIDTTNPDHAAGNRRRRPDDWSPTSSNAASPPRQRRSITLVVSGEDADAEDEDEDEDGYEDEEEEEDVVDDEEEYGGYQEDGYGGDDDDGSS